LNAAPYEGEGEDDDGGISTGAVVGSTGAVVGIAIGGAVALVLLVAVLVKRFSAKERSAEQAV
jgi:hypothetical protein